MRIHHLNCVSSCPLGGFLVDGMSPSLVRGRVANHCLLAESSHGLVLVDTGYGLRDVHDRRSRLTDLMLFVSRPSLIESFTAARQVARLGFHPRDVRHIVLTHLDADHAGGLDDFPGAEVHLLAAERDAAFTRHSLMDRLRYRPRQWGTRMNWRCYGSDEGDSSFFGFDRVRPIEELHDEIALIPLRGHTLGHAGVALRSDRGWVLHAGDAYFYYAEMSPTRPHSTPGLRLAQTLFDKDRPARVRNQERLRELVRVHGADVSVFCSHDIREFERAAGHKHDVLPGPAHNARELEEWLVDEAGLESFPASDPPAFNPGRIGGVH